MPEYAYNYDDIGNRITSTDLGTNRTYIANNLTPNFSDADKSYIKLGENDSEGTVAYYMSNGKKLKRIEPLRTDDSRDVRSGGNIQVSGWPVDPLEVELSLEDDVP